MGDWLNELDKLNEELLAKYKEGQRVKLDLGDGNVIVAKIIEIYKDYNMGSAQEVFVDVEDDNGGVMQRVLAENIVEIVKDDK